MLAHGQTGGWFGDRRGIGEKVSWPQTRHGPQPLTKPSGRGEIDESPTRPASKQNGRVRQRFHTTCDSRPKSPPHDRVAHRLDRGEPGDTVVDQRQSANPRRQRAGKYYFTREMGRPGFERNNAEVHLLDTSRVDVVFRQHPVERMGSQIGGTKVFEHGISFSERRPRTSEHRYPATRHFTPHPYPQKDCL